MPAAPFTARPEPPCVLAFDTSTERLAVGLQAGGQAWHLLAPGGPLASAALLPQISALLARAGRSRADIDHIAFGQGPGAFTGLRTACAVAQGLGLGLGRPVIALDSLLVVAEDARAQAGTTVGGFEVDVWMDARMDEVYAGRYRWDRARWQVLRTPALVPLQALQALQMGDSDAHRGAGGDAPHDAGLRQPAAVPAVDVTVATAPPIRRARAGSALMAFGSRLPPTPPHTQVFADEQDRAAALLRLAVAAAEAGEGADAALALPLYLRDKVALTTLEREQVRLAKLAP